MRRGGDLQPDALLPALQAAVGLRIIQLSQMADATRRETIRVWAADAADAVAHRGDQLMFATRPHKGEGGTANTFNHLARGLAALAHQPGGVWSLKHHWCADRSNCAETPHG